MNNVRTPQLDERLQAAADLFAACGTGADIGADHGRLSCYLLAHDQCRRMIVADISADSLAKARRLLTLHHLEDRADFRVADGLAALHENVDCVAICGMGGRVMADILERGQQRLHGAALVLSCHTEIPLLRAALVRLGYHLCAERLVRAKGRFYIVLRAEPGQACYTEKELYLGPVLLREKPALWHSYLHWREGVVSCEQGHEKQLQWIREEMQHEPADC